MIGCANHRYNLAMQKILDEDADAITWVNTLIPKLKTLLLADRLYKHTHFRAKNAQHNAMELYYWYFRSL